MEKTALSFTVTLETPFEKGIERIKATLKEEGFGVLTEIDVQKTLKDKLDVEFRKYIILGTCNPKIAYESLSQELGVGLLLPCNVIVYENDVGKTVVSAADPNTLMTLTEQKETLCKLADTASKKLQHALEKLSP